MKKFTEERFLIETNEDIKKLKIGNEQPVKVTTFFDNRNFLLTPYVPLNTAVDTIVEFQSGLEWHVEHANCGYGGNGPGRTNELYDLLGIENKNIKRNIFDSDAVLVSDDLTFSQGWGVDYLDEFIVFTPQIRQDHEKYIDTDRISDKSNYEIDLTGKTVRSYNPPRNETTGFFRLINRIKPRSIELYYGPNSPLDGYMRVKRNYDRSWGERRDDLRTTQVNITIVGQYATVHCLFDEREALASMNFICTAMTGFPLVEKQRLLFREKEIYEVREIKDGTERFPF